MAKRKKPGPVSKVTRELVQRVSDRVAQGIPIRLALAGEPVTQDAYERHLRNHPELSALQEKAKLEFLVWAIKELVRAKQLRASLCWLLERRHSDLFGRPHQPPATTVNVEQRTEVVGLSEDILRRAREYAASRKA